MEVSDPYRLENRLLAAWPLDRWRAERVVVGVSGGADSVALVRALVRIRSAERLSIVHVQHGLRPTADADATFVAQLATSLGLPVAIARVDTLAAAARAGDGLEAAARRLRYDALIHRAATVGARYVAVGHTADDQAETILHHALRGSGLAGLAGMPHARRLSDGVTLVRPLLTTRRRSVVAYLQALEQPWCEDESNRDRGFTRNRLRHELLPLLAREYNPRVVRSLLRLGRLAARTRAVVARAVEPAMARCLAADDGQTYTLDVDRLTAEPPELACELCIELWRRRDWPRGRMTLRHWDRLLELACAAADGALDLPDGVRAAKLGSRLVLSRPAR